MTFRRFLFLIIKRYFFAIFITLFLLIALGVVGYMYRNEIFHLNTGLQTEESKIIAKIDKLVFLPTGEIPTMAKVSDPEALRGQAFFVDAKKGDVVLIYTNAKKAILYDPTANKIVNISTLNIGDDKSPANQTQTTPTPTKNTEGNF